MLRDNSDQSLQAAEGSKPLRQGVLKGAMILGAAAVVSKLLGTLQKIPLQNIAGDGAFGIYNTVYPFYVLILFLSTAGFPVAISTLVSDRMAAGNKLEAKRILKVSSGILMATGIAGFALLFFGAKAFARLLDNGHTVRPLQSVSFALLLVPVLSSLRGYFQGLQDMVPTAVSQVAEQAVRVATMVALLLVFSSRGFSDEWISAGATFGSATGAAAGLLVMGGYWSRHARSAAAPAASERVASTPGASPAGPARQAGQVAEAHSAKPPTMRLIRQIVAIALPICLGSIVTPILGIVDAFTMPRLLKHEGLTELAAMADFGVYNRGLSLMQLLAMVASSVSVALVPAVAAAKANGDPRLLRRQILGPLTLTWIFALPSAAGLAVCAGPINRMLFTDSAGTLTAALTAFTALFSVLNIVTGSLLQGMGRPGVPAANLLVAAVLKLLLNALWMPAWGINGAAAAGIAAFAAAALLNLFALRREILPQREREPRPSQPVVQSEQPGAQTTWAGAGPLGAALLKPLAACAAMAAAVAAWLAAADRLLVPAGDAAGRGLSAVVALAAMGLGALVYGAVLLRLRALAAEELAALPHMPSGLLRLLQRLRLLQPPGTGRAASDHSTPMNNQ